MKSTKILVAATALTAGLMTMGQASAATVIVKAVFNTSNPGGAFTPDDPLGTILNTPLLETVGGAGNLCTKKNSCTYDFTFTLADIPAGGTTQVQLQAAAQIMGSSTPEILNYDLFSGVPGGTTFTPTSDPTHIAASSPADTVGQVILAALGDGTYYVQVMPSAVKVSGEVGSGSLTEMTPVPEPMTWTLMLTGFCGLGLALRSRRLQAAAG